MSFKFPLQNVLDLKLKDLEFAESLEAKLRFDIERIERIIEGLRLSYIDDRDKLNEFLVASKFDEVQIFESSLEHKKSKIMENLELLNRQKNNLKECLSICLELRKKTKAFTRMKEKREREHYKLEDRKQQKETDSRSALKVWQKRQERDAV